MQRILLLAKIGEDSSEGFLTENKQASMQGEKILQSVQLLNPLAMRLSPYAMHVLAIYSDLIASWGWRTREVNPVKGNKGDHDSQIEIEAVPCVYGSALKGEVFKVRFDRKGRQNMLISSI